MSVMKIPYDHFSNFVLRTPILSFDFYKKLTSKDIISDDVLKEAYSNTLIKEACFLASPTLHFELEKWINDELDDNKENKIRFSLLKYLTRMSTRPTPFGLFAGCGLGEFDDATSIKNTESKGNNRHTRLDMNYLVALSQDLAKKKEIRHQLLYFPNSSIYETGNQLRYIEYYYVNGRRQHHIVEVDSSEYLNKILKKAKSGASIADLISLLVENEILRTEAEDFIDELVESQLLVGELEPSVSGPEFMHQILEVLTKLKGTKKDIEFLAHVETQLKELDKQIGNDPQNYISLSRFIKQHPTTFELKYLFQTDMELRPKESKLSLNIVESVKKGMVFLNKLNAPIAENNLSKFKQAFFERYEEREMPLSKVLDVETGVGYIQDRGSGDINPLVDDIVLPTKEDPYSKISFEQSSVHGILEEKLIASDKIGNKKIVLTDNDFKEYPVNWEDLPDTLSAMIKIIKGEDGEKIYFSGMGGSSAANLLGRFCHGDDALNEFTQGITDLEKEMNPDKILAEIVHLPEARVGNILMRPSFRDYEIPYLAKSNLEPEYQIPIDDLCISIRGDKIFLRSKKLDKEIIPHLTNAHNFSQNALPIYQFLCDMQTQNIRGGLNFNLGHLEINRKFLPRVEYENLILQEAKWKVKKTDIQSLFLKIGNASGLKSEVNKWRQKIKLPDYALLSDGDNELLINFGNMTSVEMWLDTVKNRSEFLLTEFLFKNDGSAKSNNSYYTHQIVVSFFNQRKLDSLKKL